MAKKKNYYYVLVFTKSGPVYVTGLETHHFAIYDKMESPKEFATKEYADEVSFGLSCNFIPAVTVVTPYQLDNQHYNYEYGHFEWVAGPEAEK